MPDLKPINTGSEMKLATKPKRNTDASTSIAPTSIARVAPAASNAAVPPSGTASPNAAAASMAMVVVVLTLSGREVPSSA
jgi:hypothetical protein